MPRQLLVSVILCAAAWCLAGLQAASAVEWFNCDDPYYRKLDLAPEGRGPLELAKVFCQLVPFDFKQVAMVSPDGRSVMYLQGGGDYTAERKLLHVSRLDARDSWSSYALNIGPLWQFGQAQRSIPAYGWASDSSGIWTGTRENIGPGGITSTGLQTVFISLQDGSTRRFDPPRHAAGPLDGLLWADGDGLALAYFGARGQSYQPQRHDRHPTFAMIDAKRGLVLDTLPFDVFERLRDAYYIANVNNAAVTRLQNGKMRAVLSALDQWVVWTQGEPPQIMPSPYSDREEADDKMSISRDGSHLLVARLRCDGGYDEIKKYNSDFPRGRFSTPCKPVETVIAALFDIDTGHQIWEVRAVVPRLDFYPHPAISHDGRYALIGLPHDGSSPLPKIGLISLEDGRIVQRFRSPGPGSLNSMGFLHADGGVWVHSEGVTSLYDLHPSAQ